MFVFIFVGFLFNLLGPSVHMHEHQILGYITTAVNRNVIGALWK